MTHFRFLPRAAALFAASTLIACNTAPSMPMGSAAAQSMAKPDAMGKMDMSKMDMSAMMPPMPGMLTGPQMEALRKASDLAFDHLFLTGMIQHHTGALTMVEDLFATPAAAQDPVLFDFATDVDNTQLAEIDFMKHMLAHESSPESPKEKK